MVHAFHADGLITGDDESFLDGAIVVDEAGTILDVGPASDLLPRHRGASVTRIHGVVFPGLVNAHTHLELSALHAKVPGGSGFVPWVEGMLGARYEAAPEEDAEAISAAVADLARFATVAVGDVTNTLAAVPALSRARIGGSVFHEVFGVVRDRAMDRAKQIAEEQKAHAAHFGSDLAYAPAPHTLYTTHRDVVKELLRGARAVGARSTLHLAEHAGERLALEQGVGPIPEWLRTRLKIDQIDWPKMAPIQYAESLGALAADVLLVHLTDARENEIALVAEKGSPVVLCPRSNLHIDVKLPPLLTFLRAGIRPALGTDSLASNASLDVLSEARALLDRFPSVSARTLTTMAMANGARALGRADLGVLKKGTKPGVFAVEGTFAGDPDAWLLAHVKDARRRLVSREGAV